MSFKKRFSIGLATLAMAASAALPAQAQIVLTLADIYARDHSNSLGEQRFKEIVEERSNGELQIELYFDATLGSERELAESVVAGTIDIAPSGLSGIGLFFPELQVLEMPYLYEDLDHLTRVAEAITPDVEEIFQAEGLRNLGFWFLGPRATASSRQIETPADLEGLRLRVPESPLYVGMARFMGANPTPIAFPEVYTSLETGVADAAEGEPLSIFTTKWYEPTGSVSLTNHIWHFRQIVINGARFDSLSEEHQQILRDAGREAMLYQAGLVEELNADALQKMRDEGVEIVETTGLDELGERFVTFQDEFAGNLGDDAVALLEKVRSVD